MWLSVLMIVLLIAGCVHYVWESTYSDEESNQKPPQRNPVEEPPVKVESDEERYERLLQEIGEPIKNVVAHMEKFPDEWVMEQVCVTNGVKISCTSKNFIFTLFWVISFGICRECWRVSHDWATEDEKFVLLQMGKRMMERERQLAEDKVNQEKTIARQKAVDEFKEV